MLTQISRFDRLKDPVGVVRAYHLVKRYTDCQLVFAGGGATDDPEGDAVLAEVRKRQVRTPIFTFWICLPGAPSKSTRCNALRQSSFKKAFAKDSG